MRFRSLIEHIYVPHISIGIRINAVVSGRIEASHSYMTNVLGQRTEQRVALVVDFRRHHYSLANLRISSWSRCMSSATFMYELVMASWGKPRQMVLAG